MADASVHTVFSAECNPVRRTPAAVGHHPAPSSVRIVRALARPPQTFDWHSIAVFHSHRVRGQPGGITRLLACSEEQLKTYRGLDIGPTFVHRNHRTMGGMNYAAFNKPASVNYWIRSGAVPAGVEYVMQLDADVSPRPRCQTRRLRTAFRSARRQRLSVNARTQRQRARACVPTQMLLNRPVIPAELGVKPGTVLSAPYDYLVGTHSGLADVFGVRNKALMARVGGVHVFHISDLRRIAPLWLNFTERVRTFSCEQPERYFQLASPKVCARNTARRAGGGEAAEGPLGSCGDVPKVLGTALLGTVRDPAARAGRGAMHQQADWARSPPRTAAPPLGPRPLIGARLRTGGAGGRQQREV
eukprot:7375876-Prymnesium_polylepis.1